MDVAASSLRSNSLQARKVMGNVREFARKLLSGIKRVVGSPSDAQAAALETEAKSLALLYQATQAKKPPSSGVKAHGVVFSMDRALQLHALLCSYFALAQGAVPISVLYRRSTPEHAAAYDDLRKLMRGRPVAFVYQDAQSELRAQLLSILHGIDASRVFFLVDDDVFIESVDMADFVATDTTREVASLRLGTSLRRSYVVDKDQPLPAFSPSRPEGDGPTGKLRWRWQSGALEWGYPLSLDGHLFDREEFIAMAELIPFHSPNSLEANLQRFNRVFQLRDGVCYPNPVIVNVPCNVVQKDFPNRHGSLATHQLLQIWQRGLSIDYRRLRGLRPESTHQEIDLHFVPRPASGS